MLPTAVEMFHSPSPNCMPGLGQRLLPHPESIAKKICEFNFYISGFGDATAAAMGVPIAVFMLRVEQLRYMLASFDLVS